jgi:hypothetical protein
VVNRKKVQRLWREEGLRVPPKRRKRQRLGDSTTTPRERLRAERPDHVWALDYQFDITATGRTIKILHVVDEFTRESLADLVEHSIDADATVACLDKIAGPRGRHPAFIRCDNGPELTRTRCGTGAASPAPASATSSPAPRGRTPGSSPTAAACATSCSPDRGDDPRCRLTYALSGGAAAAAVVGATCRASPLQPSAA